MIRWLSLLIILFPVLAFAQSPITLGQTTARSAIPVVCINATTFAVQSCLSGTNPGVNVAQVGGGAVSANNTAITQAPLLIGCEGSTYGVTPTAVTSGNVRRIQCTTEGAVTVTFGMRRFSCFVQGATVMTECRANPGATLRLYITGIVLDNQAATVQGLDLVGGTGVNCATAPTAFSHKFQLGTNATTTSPHTVTASFITPLFGSVNNALCVRPTAATAYGATITGWIGQ